MTRVALGLETNRYEKITPSLCAAVADVVGPSGAAMIWYNPEHINTSDGAWEWTTVLDQNLRNAQAAGLEVWLKDCGIPPRGTIEGKCTYCKYTGGVWTYKRDENGNNIPGSAGDPNGNPGDPDMSLDWIQNPAHVNPKWSRELGHRSTYRYWDHPISQGKRPVIARLINGNEIDYGTYWPPILMCTQDESFARVTTELLLPFITGMRDAAEQGGNRLRPRPLLMGPETAGDDGLRRMVEMELQISARLFDIFGIHNYGDPGDTLAQAKENLITRMRIIDPHRRGRFAAITETGDAGKGWIIKFHRWVAATFGDVIESITTNGWQRYIDCLNPDEPDEEKREYKRNDTGAELRAFADEQASIGVRRRPSNHQSQSS